MSENAIAAAGQPAGQILVSRAAAETNTTFAILISLSTCHLLNDMNQSLVPAIYPILKQSYQLDFGQIGLITLAFQLTASMLQPVVGMVTDRRPQPYSLPVAMGCSLIGLLLLAAFIVVPHGQTSIAWFSAAALLAILLLSTVSVWYARHPSMAARRGRRQAVAAQPGGFPRRTVVTGIVVLVALLFSKNVYTASLSSYYTFYLIQKFHLSVADAQVHLFIFLGAVAAGTFAGGPIGDRIGRRPVIWFSILGAAPFAMLLPYASLMWTGVLSVVIGLILASAFSAILVYAQELLPGRVGMVAGMFFGFSFGLGGLGAAALGRIADASSIEAVYQVCSFLPLIGLLTAFLPNVEKRRK
ncbi:MAG: MFS transporter [Acetobacteraceae bacterium]